MAMTIQNSGKKPASIRQHQAVIRAVEKHQAALRQCRLCPGMQPPVVTCGPVSSKILLIGQAPGDKEGALGRPFAWTAGKTLFKWFSSIGMDEDEFRRKVFMSAVCRCFPGKNPKGGDRVPDKQEVANCSQWLQAEFELLQPQLVIPVGKLAINRLLQADRLADVIGHCVMQDIAGYSADVIALPHPSGASTWHRTQPGKDLLQDALRLIAQHPAWQQALAA